MGGLAYETEDVRHGRGGASMGGVEVLLSNNLMPGGIGDSGSTGVFPGYGIRELSGRYTMVQEPGIGQDESGSGYRLGARLLRRIRW